MALCGFLRNGVFLPRWDDRCVRATHGGEGEPGSGGGSGSGRVFVLQREEVFFLSLEKSGAVRLGSP